MNPKLFDNELIDDLPTTWRASAAHVLSCSEFVAESLARDAELVADLERADALRSPRLVQGASCWPQGVALSLSADEVAAQRWLRLWRRREMVRIAWRDLAGLATLEETLADLSAFADDAVQLAVDYAMQAMITRYGAPLYDDGQPMPLSSSAWGSSEGGS